MSRAAAAAAFKWVPPRVPLVIPSPPFMRRRIPSLDGLRAISIGLVMCGHLAGTRGYPTTLLFLKPYANLGVRVFFVLSGYLITRLLLDEHEKSGILNLREFYRRRAYRIFPPAYAYILAIAVFLPYSIAGRDVLVASLYLSSYFSKPWIYGHLWSLSVEEQFYLVWPFALATAFAARKALAIGAMLAGPALRLVFHFLGWQERQFHPLTVADSIATGCLLAIIWQQLQAYDHVLLSRRAAVLPVAALAIPLIPVLSPSYLGQGLYEIFGLTVLHAAIAGCIYNAVKMEWRWLNTRPIIWTGLVSYSLYLWQQPFLNRYEAKWWTAFPVNILLALVCAAGSYYAVEGTSLRIRDRARAVRASVST